jgi:hypothetical protein
MSAAHREPARLSIWTIYDHPADYPESFVARRWEGDQPTTDIIVAPSLSVIRCAMERRNLHWLARHKSDDPVILESWL